MAAIGLLFRGGFMMWPLLISALIAVTVICERIYIFSFRLRSQVKLVVSTIDLTRKGHADVALGELPKAPHPVVSVLAAGLENADRSDAQVELSMRNRAELWLPVIEKRQDILDTIITAAPLMGLLGTITGMMASFQVLSEKGVNEPHAITGGVAEALIATATGLVIALLSLLAFNYLGNRSRSLVAEMESASSRLIEALKYARELQK